MRTIWQRAGPSWIYSAAALSHVVAQHTILQNKGIVHIPLSLSILIQSLFTAADNIFEAHHFIYFFLQIFTQQSKFSFLLIMFYFKGGQ